MPGGRPLEYSKVILTKAREYLDSCIEFYDDKESGIKVVNIPTIEGLAVHLKVSRETVYAWEKDGDKQEFSDIIGELRAKQATALINQGLSGNYNPTIAKVLLTKHGYREGIDATTNDKPIETSAESIIKAQEFEKWYKNEHAKGD